MPFLSPIQLFWRPLEHPFGALFNNLSAPVNNHLAPPLTPFWLNSNIPLAAPLQTIRAPLNTLLVAPPWTLFWRPPAISVGITVATSFWRPPGRAFGPFRTPVWHPLLRAFVTHPDAFFGYPLAPFSCPFFLFPCNCGTIIAMATLTPPPSTTPLIPLMTFTCKFSTICKY